MFWGKLKKMDMLILHQTDVLKLLFQIICVSYKTPRRNVKLNKVFITDLMKLNRMSHEYCHYQVPHSEEEIANTSKGRLKVQKEPSMLSLIQQFCFIVEKCTILHLVRKNQIPRYKMVSTQLLLNDMQDLAFIKDKWL